jgi:5-methylcytosine-specific restriction endonuclease McrA
VTISAATRQFVRTRAANRCEYCQLHQVDSPLASLHVEHVIPIKHGGSDEEENLALACIDCNLHKGSNLAGLDPETGQLTRLFHPRQQIWDEHFSWNGIFLVGTTDVGRTTVVVFNLNSEDQLALRSIC